jgi:prephenate dehydrogenase
MRVAFLGLGLIGGSVARALREDDGFRDDELVAWSPSGEGPRQALEQGVLDAVAGDPGIAVDGAALVVLAGPPLACIELLERLGGELRDTLAPGVTVTDVASTKAALTRAAGRAHVPYVGGHPMAGRETTGFGAADATLFRGRPWVITQPVAGGDPEAVRRLALACGGQPVTIDAERHDLLVAGISHLPLLASVALVEVVAGAGDDGDPDWPAARALAAGGWRDTTRLARGDPRMGAEIAATNAPALADLLGRYRDRLDAFLADLEAAEGPDADALERRLARAAQRLATEP